MTPAKRAFDIAAATLGLLLLWPVMLALAAAILWRDGRPILYGSERMRSRDRGFTLWKFRTMRPAAADAGVTGADKSDRITATGRWLRRYRLDELPQLINVLGGDLSLVGPRPPLRRYVEAAPGLYGAVLRSRPGLTGLATLLYHRREAELLSACRSAAETHRVYLDRCVPAKARLDLLYQRHASPGFDLWILWRTLVAVTGGPPRPAAPRRARSASSAEGSRTPARGGRDDGVPAAAGERPPM